MMHRLTSPQPGISGGESGAYSLRVAVTGAFLTGCPLQVRFGAYRDLQKKLEAEFREFGEIGWTVEPEAWRIGGTYDSGGGFAQMLPSVIARRGGPALLGKLLDLIGGRVGEESQWIAEQTDGWNFEALSVRVDFHDVGVAVLNATFEVRAPDAMPLSDVARLLKGLVLLKPNIRGVSSPITAAFRELATETSSQFAQAIRRGVPEAIQERWLSSLRFSGRGDNDQPGSDDDRGRLLWLHPVHILEVDAETEPLQKALDLAPPFRETIRISDGVFAPGIGWSAIVIKAGSSAEQIPLRLIELQWAYIAHYMEIDRGLLGLLDDDRWNELESLAALESDADRVFGNYMRVMHVRARLDSDLASLGGDEFALWETISEVAKFGPLIEGVDRKMKGLQQVSERRVQQAEAQRLRRTSRILGGLTALTIVTVTVALIGNFLGSRSDEPGHLEWRVVIVAAALAGSVLVYWLAHREKAHKLRGLGSKPAGRA